MSRYLAAVAMFFLLALGEAGAALPPAGIMELKAGSYTIDSDGAAPATPPAFADAGQPLLLPQRMDNPAQHLVRAWFRLPFHLERQPDLPLGLLLPRVYSGGDVFLNGELIGRIEGSSPTIQAHWLRPHFFTLPASLLRAGENILQIGVASRYARFGIGPPVVGPVDSVKPIYEDRLFIEYSMALVAVWLMFMGGSFLLFT
jgi:hypothetical protein